MEYLYYQLHVSASTLAIIRLAFNLSSDYTICVEQSVEFQSPLYLLFVDYQRAFDSLTLR